MKELRAFLPGLHARGKCLHDPKRDPPLATNRATGVDWVQANYKLFGEYLFVFGTENSLAEGYHSEKMYDAFTANSLLVYLGNQGGKEYLPKSKVGHPSYIDATSFSSPVALANYLLYLSQNVTAYQRYFSWRTEKEPHRLLKHAIKGSIQTRGGILCRVCACTCNVTCRTKRVHKSLGTMFK